MFSYYSNYADNNRHRILLRLLMYAKDTFKYANPPNVAVDGISLSIDTN